MKYLILSLLVLSACGKSGSSTQSPTGVVHTSGPTSTQSTYTLTASINGGDHPASQSFSVPVTVTVPQSGQSNADATDNINATLSIGSITCTYSKPAGNSTYSFHDCTGGYTPGSNITIPSNSTVTFSIQSGYCTQACVAQISVLVTQ